MEKKTKEQILKANLGPVSEPIGGFTILHYPSVCTAMQQYADQETSELRAELERVKKEREWVSVKDRLPDLHTHVMSEDVIVFTGHGTDVSRYDYELKRWTGSPFIVVSHWMQKPEPPKE